MGNADSKAVRAARALLQQARELVHPVSVQGSCGIGPRTPHALRTALSKLDEAVAVCPNLPEVYVERSIVRADVGDKDRAREDAQRAFELRPADAHSYIFISFCFPWPERRRILRTAMRRLRGSPSDRVSLWRNLVYSYWYEGRFEEQVREAKGLLGYRKRVRYFQRVDLDHSILGSALEALGQYEEAEQSYRKGLRSRYGANLASNVVLARVRRNDFQGAEAALKTLRIKMPRDLASLLQASILGLRGERASCSPKTLAKATEENVFGGVGLYAFYAAVVLLRMGQGANARELLRRYVAHIESNPREWGITNRWEVAKAKELLAV